MIPYKLAKQLKDAGFPQEGNGKFVNYWIYGTFYIPTLSELIEEFEEIDFSKGKPGCMTRSGIELETGDTPEEAVAKLWLKLNKQ